MKLAEKLTEIISKELSKPSSNQKNKDFDKLLNEMKNAGILKKPVYDLPPVDTIGKNYYSLLNRRK